MKCYSNHFTFEEMTLFINVGNECGKSWTPLFMVDAKFYSIIVAKTARKYYPRTVG